MGKKRISNSSNIFLKCSKLAELPNENTEYKSDQKKYGYYWYPKPLQEKALNYTEC